ncbi:MAG: flagellar hook-basal body complex protein [Terracidiphilus sp.]
MISLKKYLESQQKDSQETAGLVEGDLLPAVVDAYGSALLEMGHASLDACPGMGDELKRHLGEFKSGLSAGMFDSLGEPHVATVTFEPGAAVNTWTYSVALPAADYSVAGANVAPAAITGTMTFNANGNLISINPGGAGAETVGTAPGDFSSIALNFNPAATNVLVDGAAGLNIQWNLMSAGGTPNISQVDTQSAVSGTMQDGYTSGQYNGFTIGSDGTVTATYSNGKQENVGQKALANVANNQGLNLMGNGDYLTTQASGTAVVGTSGTSGLATLQDDALEASNVNISTEFSDLIIAQRAFEANAKSVTTFDTVTQDTINMVH